MKRILFVDDEPAVLQGLRRMLHGEARDWEMVFVETASAALDRLAAEPFDVAVVDLALPAAADGLALLAEIRDRHPSVVRLVLSAHGELQASLQAAPLAHQFLAKPTDGATLRRTVARACHLRDLMHDGEVRAAVGRIESLPPLPSVYARLTATLAEPEVSLEKVADIVQEDPAIAGKVLQLVNSAFFGLSRTVHSIADATRFLGLDTLRALVLSVEVFRNPAAPAPEYATEEEREHALLVGRLASRIAGSKLAGDAFLAGVLHDIGKLILATHLGERFAPDAREARESGRPLAEVEYERHGLCHAEVGAYLLDLWGLPYPLIEAVAHHHRPHRVPEPHFGLVGAVHVADAMVRGATRGAEPSLDLAYLEETGQAGEIARWQAQADRLGIGAGAAS